MYRAPLTKINPERPARRRRPGEVLREGRAPSKGGPARGAASDSEWRARPIPDPLPFGSPNSGIFNRVKPLGILILLALAASLPACGKKLEEQLKDSVRNLDNASLKRDDVEILQVTENGDLAIAEVKVRTAFKLRKKDGSWTLEEIRIGDRRWEKAETILEAINARRAEITRRDLEALAGAIARYAQATGGVPQTEGFEALVDTLAPQYLNQVVRLDAWSNGFSYSPLSKDRFDLRSAGPDGQFQTADDLVARSSQP